MALELSVSGLSGYLCSVCVGADASLSDAKAAIEDSLRIPALEQRLIHGTTELRDVRALDDLPRSEPLNLILVRRTPEQVQWLREFEKLHWAQVIAWLATAAPEAARDDRDTMLRAVARTGGALQYASEQLRSNRPFVLEALAQCGSGLALSQTSLELRGDQEVALTAVSRHASALPFASESLQADREFVLAAVAENGLVLEFVSEKLRSDREVVTAAVTSCCAALRFAAPELQHDRRIVQAAAAATIASGCCVARTLSYGGA